jgi:hypothetical protein
MSDIRLYKKIRDIVTMTIVSLVLPALGYAKDWVVLPGTSGSLVTGQSLGQPVTMQGLDLTTSITELDAHLVTGLDTAPSVPSGYVVQETTAVHMFAVMPNDPDFDQQWYLDNIAAPEAWDQSQGNGTLIAVLDSGIDGTHPDLAGKVVDGQNFVGGSSYSDDLFHGTFCASLVAASINDGIGMAGLSPNVQLLSVKVLDSSGNGTDFGVAQGIVWAVDRGAKVINLSLGGSTPSLIMSDAVNYALSRNVVVVAAAGNSGQNEMFYPASFQGVISVGACTRTDEKASYSTYNSALSVMAPGGDGSSDPQEQILGAVPGGVYNFGSGTSYASPQVAAAAALYLSLHPLASAAEVFAAITSTADPIDVTPGYSVTTGWGRLNVGRLLGVDVGPNLFQAGPIPASVPALGTPMNFEVAAAVPGPSALNLATSPISSVWAILIDQDGDEVLRQKLSQVGPRDYAAQAVLPDWMISTDRQLSVTYVAVDQNGVPSQTLEAGETTQLAYINSLDIQLVHVQPQGIQPGQSMDLHVDQVPARPACTNWTLNYRNNNGTWLSQARNVNPNGGADFVVPSMAVLAGNFDYYFSAADANGKTIRSKDAASPWDIAILKEVDAVRMTALINPSPEICVRVESKQSDSLNLKVYNIAGELVENYSQAVIQGDNRICLDKVVASGVYFAVSSLAGQNDRATIKLAIKR